MHNEIGTPAERWDREAGKLVDAIERRNNEEVHIYYDSLLRLIIEHDHPEVLEELDNLVGNIPFWYS